MMDKHIQLQISGMTCSHCAVTVEKALSGVAGVKNAKASFPEGLAQVDVTDNVAAAAHHKNHENHHQHQKKQRENHHPGRPAPPAIYPHELALLLVMETFSLLISSES